MKWNTRATDDHAIEVAVDEVHGAVDEERLDEELGT